MKNVFLAILSCGSDKFQCNQHQCIATDWRCDGIPDCHNGEDEIGCDTDTGDTVYGILARGVIFLNQKNRVRNYVNAWYDFRVMIKLLLNCLCSTYGQPSTAISVKSVMGLRKKLAEMTVSFCGTLFRSYPLGSHIIVSKLNKELFYAS